MPPMTVWPVSSSSLTENVGSSSASFWIAVPSFSWSDLVLGSIETWMTGSGKRHRLEDDLVLRVAQGVTGGGVLQADDRVDVAGHGLVDRVLLVGVHLEELAEALLLALGRVDAPGRPESIRPEYTRTKVSLPKNGCAAILNASAANGSSRCSACG